jgi:hypothetical protein
MKTKLSPWRAGNFRARRGFLEVDMMVALAIIVLALLPLGYSFVRERQVLRLEYQRCVADEIVDGEMEILAVGAGRNLPDGARVYSVQGDAAGQLPPGHFQLTKNGKHLRLEWTPDKKRHLGPVVRETTLP